MNLNHNLYNPKSNARRTNSFISLRSNPSVQTQSDLQQKLNGLERLQDDYTRNVVSKLDNVRAQLSHMNPLNYRLEILENVYSLIYLSAHDLKNDEDHTSDEEDNIEIQKLPGVAMTKTEIFIEQQMNNESMRSEYDIINTSELAAAGHEEFSIYAGDAEDKRLKPNFNYRSRSDFGGSISRLGSVTEDFDDAESQGGHGRKRSLISLYRRNAGGGGSFLVNDYLCRDILLLVNDLLQVFRDKGSMMSKLEDLSPMTYCSILSVGEVSERASKLQQVVADTLWRYQLVKPGVVSLEYGVLNGVLVEGVDGVMFSGGGGKQKEQEVEVYELMKKRKQMEASKMKSRAESYLAFSLEKSTVEDMMTRKMIKIR